jgi:hypothetical protein
MKGVLACLFNRVDTEFRTQNHFRISRNFRLARSAPNAGRRSRAPNMYWPHIWWLNQALKRCVDCKERWLHAALNIHCVDCSVAESKSCFSSQKLGLQAKILEQACMRPAKTTLFTICRPECRRRVLDYGSHCFHPDFFSVGPFGMALIVLRSNFKLLDRTIDIGIYI